MLRYSKGFSEKNKNLSQKGYVPVMGKIRFIVAWKNKDNGEEYAVILPLFQEKMNLDHGQIYVSDIDSLISATE